MRLNEWTAMSTSVARRSAGSVGPPQALIVLATVMSATQPGLAVLDAGHKAVAVNNSLPLVWQCHSVRYTGASDEHGKTRGI